MLGSSNETDTEYIVRDASGRHMDYPAYTMRQAEALIVYFTKFDSESRCYIIPIREKMERKPCQ